MEAVKEYSQETKTRADKLGSRYWRLNNLYWILDDHGNRIQFKMNYVQIMLYKALWWLNMVLKSRQHGVTTLCCLYFLDACLFNSNVRAGIVCHKLDDAKRIFSDKVKYAYTNLPADLKASISLIKDDAMELRFSNNSSIYIGASMRSGTLQYLHISEYPWLCAHNPLKAKEVKTGAMETIHAGGMIIIEGTAEGANTDFENMYKDAETVEKSGAELTRLDYKTHFFPWYMKSENVLDEKVAISAKLIDYFKKIEKITGDTISLPHRKWYAKKFQILKNDIFKEHPSTAEEAFHAAIIGAYLGQEMIIAKSEGRIGDFPYDRRARVFTFWDIGTIHTAIWYCQFIRDWIYCIECYYDNSGQGLYHHIKMLQNKPYIYADHYTGWDINPDNGSNRKDAITGNLIVDDARELNVDFKILDKYPFNNRVQAGRDVLPKCRFNKDTTEVGVAALFNWRQSIDKANSTTDNPVYTNKPAPGNQNHLADSFTHMALAYLKKIYMGERMGQVSQTPPLTNKERYAENVRPKNIMLRGIKIH